MIPLRVHGRLETPFVPALLVLPWATGALRELNARRYFFSFTAQVDGEADLNALVAAVEEEGYQAAPASW